MLICYFYFLVSYAMCRAKVDFDLNYFGLHACRCCEIVL